MITAICAADAACGAAVVLRVVSRVVCVREIRYGYANPMQIIRLERMRLLAGRVNDDDDDDDGNIIIHYLRVRRAALNRCVRACSFSKMRGGPNTVALRATQLACFCANGARGRKICALQHNARFMCFRFTVSTAGADGLVFCSRTCPAAAAEQDVSPGFMEHVL